MFHPKGPTLVELAVQALSSTDRGYDLIASKFDYTPFRTPDVVLEGMRPLLGEVDRGLDVCCGTGAGAHLIRPHCRELVVGIDRSAGMLGEASRQAQLEPDGTPMQFIRGDARQLPFTSAFDLAVCFGAFGHILPSDEPAFVASIHRALRPGGRFVFATSRMPSTTSWQYWAARGFNGVMHVRNAVKNPPFVMFYLTFLWPSVGRVLEQAGFRVEVHEDVFEAPFGRGVAVVATKD
jgi:ubiquinone/menaquinone biosynthesis C-methylase UbiE